MRLKTVSFIFIIGCFVTGGARADDDNGDADAAAATDATVVLTKDNFDTELAKTHYFVKFYAPWCGHCQRLAPTWAQLAEMLNEKEGSRVKIGKVDCTQENEICSKHDVTGYPTLRFFKTDAPAGDSVKFRGTRDLPSLTNFINEQLGETAPAATDADDQATVDIPTAMHGLVELTDATFGKHVATGKHFVKFYAPWCGHCQKLAPTWEELARSLEYEPSVSIAKIDCTQYRSICQDFEVKGYPTLLWIEDGKKVEKYAGPRTHEDLKAYVDKMAGGSGKEAAAAAGQNDTADNDKNDNKGEEPQNVVVQLTGASFGQGIERGVTFVKFFAPWCGHCKRMAPTWDQLAIKYVGKAGVTIAKVDCTLAENKELCADQEVNGFPTLFIYKDGAKITEYNGSRSLDDLYEFVGNHLAGAEDDHDEL